MSSASLNIYKKPILIAMLFFAIAAILGLSMRYAFMADVPEWYNYRNVQHAHSHVALLGWLFAIFYIIIIQAFGLKWVKYSKLYWALQGAVMVMLITFPIIGYKSISILFSIIHIVLLYVFFTKVWKDVNRTTHGQLPVLFLRASLFFLILSTIGTLAIAPILAAGLKGTAIYYASIQFYLHFLFNGWFIFAVVAVFFQVLDSHQIEIDRKRGILFFWSLIIGTVLTYALAVTWSTPFYGIFMINSLGVVIQLFAIGVFIQLIRGLKKSCQQIMSPFVYRVLGISLLAIVLKVFIQTVVVFPALAEISYTIRNLVIGFIHLLMLGGLSLFAFAMVSRIFNKSMSKAGIIIFISGIVITEFLLFIQGLMQWQGWGFMMYYYELIAGGSLFIVIGLIILLIQMPKMTNTPSETTISE